MLLLVSVEARLEWAVSAGRPSFSSENETPFVRLARSQLLQCDDRQMCKATKETQKITLCITKDARRIRREDECCAKRRDANDKKTSFGIPYPINNPPIRAGMQKKMLQASQWTKNTQKCVSHFFSNVCELQFKYT